jgi:hypothetical protein
VSRLSAQTLVFSETTGCLTATNHPFAAPCQPFLYAQSSAGTGSSITITGTILGVSFTQVQLVLPVAASSMQIEQVSSVMGAVDTSGGVITTPAGSQTVGSNRATSGADNDPGTPGGASQTNSTSQSGMSLTAGPGGSANSIGISSGWADSGVTTSTAAASASPACADLGGSPQLTGLPCGSGSTTQSGTTSLVSTGLYAGTASLLSAPLFSAAAAPSSTAAFVGRYTTGTPSYCTSTSGDGCVHAGAQRSLGTVEFAGLPGQLLSGLGLDGVAPVGWGNTVGPNANCPTGNYMVALTNYSDRVAAESGVNANSATTTMPAGASQPYVCFWNGTGYTSQALSLGTTPQALSIPALSVIDAVVPGGAVTVSVSSSLSVGTATTTRTTPTGCATPCQSTATISSPLVGSITYQVTQGATTIANLTETVNLGELTVSTSYQAAP